MRHTPLGRKGWSGGPAPSHGIGGAAYGFGELSPWRVRIDGAIPKKLRYATTDPITQTAERAGHQS